MAGERRSEQATETSLTLALRACRREFVLVGIFSGVVNLLQLTTSIYMMQLFDRVIATRVVETLLYLSLIAVAAVLVLALLEAVRGEVMLRVAEWVEHKVAPESFVRAIESGLRGSTYRMEALRDLAACRNYLGSPAALSLYDVPWLPIYLAVIFVLHPVMGWIALGGALTLFGLAIASDLSTSKLLREVNTAASTVHRRLEAMSRNAEVIDSMGMLPAVIARWRRSTAATVEPQRRAGHRATVLLAATKFFRLAVQIAIFGVGAYLVLGQELTAGASLAGAIIMGRALAPVEQMIGGWKLLVQARQSFRRLQTFLAEPRLRPPGLPLPEPAGHLCVERVSYGFPGQSAPMIKAVNFNLAAGESLGIIGPSAAGKTTLVRLLIGTLRPVAGCVRLDGADVSRWMREDLGQHLGYLPQDVELFDGTVFANIARMGDPGKGSVYEAARLAGCHNLILRLPNGYQTEIGDGALYLSGGQRQLVGLARAVFGRPKLVVLDEPNSNLDGASERALLRALEQLKARGTTLIVVSHRPSIVSGLDKILLLKDGAMEMFGPTAEVLRRLMNKAQLAETRKVAIDAPPEESGETR